MSNQANVKGCQCLDASHRYGCQSRGKRMRLMPSYGGRRLCQMCINRISEGHCPGPDTVEP